MWFQRLNNENIGQQVSRAIEDASEVYIMSFIACLGFSFWFSATTPQAGSPPSRSLGFIRQSRWTQQPIFVQIGSLISCKLSGQITGIIGMCCHQTSNRWKKKKLYPADTAWKPLTLQCSLWNVVYVAKWCNFCSTNCIFQAFSPFFFSPNRL